MWITAEIRREIWEAIPTFVSLVSRVISQSKSLRLQDESGGLQTIDEALQIMKRSLPDTLIKLAKHGELQTDLSLSPIHWRIRGASWSTYTFYSSIRGALE